MSDNDYNDRFSDENYPPYQVAKDGRHKFREVQEHNPHPKNLSLRPLGPEPAQQGMPYNPIKEPNPHDDYVSIKSSDLNNPDKYIRMDDLFRQHRSNHKLRFFIGCKRIHNILKNDSEGVNTKGVKYKYCSIRHLLDEIYEIFTPLGILVMQKLYYDNNAKVNLIITSVIDMPTGRDIVLSSYAVPDFPISPAQTSKEVCWQAGEVITYFRRYELYAVLNCFAGNDKDGVPVNNNQDEPHPQKVVKSTATARSVIKNQNVNKTTGFSGSIHGDYPEELE